MSVFDSVLKEMNERGQMVSDPRSFQDYLTDSSIPQRGTWSCISIDSLSRLDTKLRENGVFVFRLGKASGGTGTSFSCVSYGSTENLPFIDDNRDFTDKNIKGFIPKVPYSDLHPFILMPSFTESTAVNLGLASGLIPHALEIEGRIGIPATGQSTYTFEFTPLENQDQRLTHLDGQIEIDSLFTARRNGRDQLFLLEAKCSKKLDSLAKHKLAYPYFALRSQVPEYIDIIPVYLRVTKANEQLLYYVSECRFTGTALESLEVWRTQAFELPRGLGF